MSGLSPDDCVRLNLLSQPASSAGSSPLSAAPLAKPSQPNAKNGKVPLFNHFNAKDWISKRAAYNKED